MKIPADATSLTLLLKINQNAPAREMAWRDFYELYAPIISGFARRMGARQQDVADIVQDVMAGFFSASPQFVYDPLKGRFRGYLKTCTWRLFRKRMGNAMLANERSLDHAYPPDVVAEEAWNDVWETEKLQRAMAIVRDRYLGRPDKMKTFRAFELYVLLERDADGVSKELAMPVASVHQAKTRVSKAIRAEMDSMEELA
jgi:DNA-directed RNA polymerase specialized sigma24 family protein